MEEPWTSCGSALFAAGQLDEGRFPSSAATLCGELLARRLDLPQERSFWNDPCVKQDDHGIHDNYKTDDERNVMVTPPLSYSPKKLWRGLPQHLLQFSPEPKCDFRHGSIQELAHSLQFQVCAAAGAARRVREWVSPIGHTCATRGTPIAFADLRLVASGASGVKVDNQAHPFRHKLHAEFSNLPQFTHFVDAALVQVSGVAFVPSLPQERSFWNDPCVKQDDHGIHDNYKTDDERNVMFRPPLSYSPKKLWRGLPQHLLQFSLESNFCDFRHGSIQELARSLQSPDCTVVEAARRVREWVSYHIVYTFQPMDDSASTTLAKREGMCMNKTNLQVALLRAMGIPAGFVIGYISRDMFAMFGDNYRFLAKTTFHAYAAAYIPLGAGGEGKFLSYDGTFPLSWAGVPYNYSEVTGEATLKEVHWTSKPTVESVQADVSSLTSLGAGISLPEGVRESLNDAARHVWQKAKLASGLEEDGRDTQGAVRWKKTHGSKNIDESVAPAKGISVGQEEFCLGSDVLGRFGTFCHAILTSKLGISHAILSGQGPASDELEMSSSTSVPALVAACRPMERSYYGSSTQLVQVTQDDAKTQVFAISDIHTDKIDNMDFIRSWPLRPQAVLIVAGDVSHDMSVLRATFHVLLERFGRVFFCPGNHDLWLHSGDPACACNSIEKLEAVQKMCDDLGVLTRPTIVGNIRIVPLHSWYHAGFDIDPDVVGPDMAVEESLMDFRCCVWPAELTPFNGSDSIARYMDQLNPELPTEFTEGTGPLITFSHFLPLPELLPEKRLLQFPPLAKVVGSQFLERRVKSLKPDLHVFGHTHFAWRQEIAGTTYIQACLAYPRERRERLFSIYLADESGAEVSPPLLLFEGNRWKFVDYSAFWSAYYNRTPRQSQDVTWIYGQGHSKVDTLTALRGVVDSGRIVNENTIADQLVRDESNKLDSKPMTMSES